MSVEGSKNRSPQINFFEILVGSAIRKTKFLYGDTKVAEKSKKHRNMKIQTAQKNVAIQNGATTSDMT